MINSRPFARSLAIFAAMSALIGQGVSFAAAAQRSGAANYKSRGKGRSNNRFAALRRYVGKAYPFSSTKQHQKHATSQHTVIINGFPLMQTRRTGNRLSMSQVAA